MSMQKKMPFYKPSPLYNIFLATSSSFALKLFYYYINKHAVKGKFEE